MFEFVVALKYLLPKKKALSTSLISLLAVFVIALVVWLVLVFLSVTTGIEKNWLRKLTSLNAPLRITPTEDYFSSYYYQIDQFSSDSKYSLQSIGEKERAEKSDPYSPIHDIEIPSYFPSPDLLPNGSLKDPVKEAFASLKEIKEEYPEIAFQDYEMSGAFMRLSLLRQDHSLLSEKTSFLSQMTYLLSFTDKNPALSDLLIKPSTQDLNNLLFQMAKSGEELKKDLPDIILPTASKNFASYLQSFFSHLNLKKIRNEENFPFSEDLLPEGSFQAVASRDHKRIFLLGENRTHLGGLEGKLIKNQKELIFEQNSGASWTVPSGVSLLLREELIWDASIVKESLAKAESLDEILLNVNTKLGERELAGVIPFHGISLEEAESQTLFSSHPENAPLWAHFWQNPEEKRGNLPQMGTSTGILLPKGYRDNGVLLGDKGYLSYVASAGTSTQEQRLSIYVAGFYDPGVMPIGNRCLIVPNDITRTISSSSSTFSPDGTAMNGILVWTNEIHKATYLKTELERLFKEKGIAPYFRIATYKEYEFSKELMQQFQSDRTLFTLLASIVIFVACCNIISLLILLVNDKKKEIAILVAMGASKRSIAAIFGFAGIVMGTLSSLLGTLAAILTLSHLDVLVSFLSALQGHAAFQTAFFGDSLPNEISSSALIFVLLITPLLSLAAGLIPALKATKIKASHILRTE